MKKASSVDGYIDSAPKEIQAKLKELRKIIKETAPEAEERISYAMPAYKYHGWLVYFAYWEKHIGIYGIRQPVREKFKVELKKYHMTKGAIQLPNSDRLPKGLIKKLIKAQMLYNSGNERR